MFICLMFPIIIFGEGRLILLLYFNTDSSVYCIHQKWDLKIKSSVFAAGAWDNKANFLSQILHFQSTDYEISTPKTISSIRFSKLTQVALSSAYSQFLDDHRLLQCFALHAVMSITSIMLLLDTFSFINWAICLRSHLFIELSANTNYIFILCFPPLPFFPPRVSITTSVLEIPELPAMSGWCKHDSFLWLLTTYQSKIPLWYEKRREAFHRRHATYF